MVAQNDGGLVFLGDTQRGIEGRVGEKKRGLEGSLLSRTGSCAHRFRGKKGQEPYRVWSSTGEGD